jgi:ubiquinone/menaquinone biosynthesis C-methylase UbiE
MKVSDLKWVVQEKYAEIAQQAKASEKSGCCGPSGCCSTIDYAVFADNYDREKGYVPDADLGLGCGIPTQFAGINPGDSVLDLGSGAGNDCFVARALVGESGRVTGIDFTQAMVDRANANNTKLGFDNVSFVLGDIEAMPFEDNRFDVIVSNCVLNLVPDKQKAFSEMHRVLKAGGRFCVSDVVIKGTLPIKLQKDAELYAGCVSGALPMDEYLRIIQHQGFEQCTVHTMKEIVLPEALLATFANDVEMDAFRRKEAGIYSITVSAGKGVSQ